jgi:hypothetical protein
MCEDNLRVSNDYRKLIQSATYLGRELIYTLALSQGQHNLEELNCKLIRSSGSSVNSFAGVKISTFVMFTFSMIFFICVIVDAHFEISDNRQ